MVESTVNDFYEDEKRVFFFGSYLSQWHPAKFTIDGYEYNCAE